jgi:hypothetical protein
MPVRRLRVYTNPYHCVDHNGWPTGACHVDIQDTDARAYVGARFSRHGTKLLVSRDEAEKMLKNQRTPPQVSAFVFKMDPIELPDSRYYRNALRSGELLPADTFTAALAKVPFKPVEQARTEAMNARRVGFDARWGDGAFDSAQTDYLKAIRPPEPIQSPPLAEPIPPTERPTPEPQG